MEPHGRCQSYPSPRLEAGRDILPFGSCYFGQQSVRRNWRSFLCFTPSAFPFTSLPWSCLHFVCLPCQCWCWTHGHLYWNWCHARRSGSRKQSRCLWLCRQATATEMPDGSSGGMSQPSTPNIPFAFWRKFSCRGGGTVILKEILSLWNFKQWVKIVLF